MEQGWSVASLTVHQESTVDLYGSVKFQCSNLSFLCFLTDYLIGQITLHHFHGSIEQGFWKAGR